MKDGQHKTRQLFATTWAIILNIIVCIIIIIIILSIEYSVHIKGAVTSSSGEFGLSYKTPILQEPMCTGSEYSLKDCPGYTPGNIAGDYCLSGGHHVGVRCIEGVV